MAWWVEASDGSGLGTPRLILLCGSTAASSVTESSLTAATRASMASNSNSHASRVCSLASKRQHLMLRWTLAPFVKKKNSGVLSVGTLNESRESTKITGSALWRRSLKAAPPLVLYKGGGASLNAAQGLDRRQALIGQVREWHKHKSAVGNSNVAG